MGIGQLLLCLICPPAWLVWFFGRIIYAFMKGFYVGRQLRKMRKGYMNPATHPIFQDANWGKYFQGVKKELEAKQPKVAVIVEDDEVPLLADHLDSIQNSWK